MESPPPTTSSSEANGSEDDDDDDIVKHLRESYLDLPSGYTDPLASLPLLAARELFAAAVDLTWNQLTHGLTSDLKAELTTYAMNIVDTLRAASLRMNSFILLPRVLFPGSTGIAGSAFHDLFVEDVTVSQYFILHAYRDYIFTKMYVPTTGIYSHLSTYTLILYVYSYIFSSQITVCRQPKLPTYPFYVC